MGKLSQLTNIFARGWNHQLENISIDTPNLLPMIELRLFGRTAPLKKWQGRLNNMVPAGVSVDKYKHVVNPMKQGNERSLWCLEDEFTFWYGLSLFRLC